jgi:hypothetical protein
MHGAQLLVYPVYYMARASRGVGHRYTAPQEEPTVKFQWTHWMDRWGIKRAQG